MYVDQWWRWLSESGTSKIKPSQNTNVYHMVVQCSQMFANIQHSITVFNEHLFDVCADSSKCEKRLCPAGRRQIGWHSASDSHLGAAISGMKATTHPKTLWCDNAAKRRTPTSGNNHILFIIETLLLIHSQI